MCRYQWLLEQGRRPERGLEPCGTCEACQPSDLDENGDDPIDDDDDGS